MWYYGQMTTYWLFHDICVKFSRNVVNHFKINVVTETTPNTQKNIVAELLTILVGILSTNHETYEPLLIQMLTNKRSVYCRDLPIRVAETRWGHF